MQSVFHHMLSSLKTCILKFIPLALNFCVCLGSDFPSWPDSSPCAMCLQMCPQAYPEPIIWSACLSVLGVEQCQAEPGKFPGRPGCGGERLAPGHHSASSHSPDYLGDSIFPLEKYIPSSSQLTYWTIRNGTSSLWQTLL